MSDLPRAKGSRPVFLGSEATDDLLAIIMAVTQELAVVRERLDTAERLLVDKGVLGPSDMESYEPDQATALLREQWRGDYLDRVLFAVKARAAQTATGETRAEYDRIVEEVGSANS